MQISSATFLKSVVGEDEVLEEGLPQVAFIGRSNVGKSSTINALVKQKGLARSSSFPGLTQHINVFLINHKLHLIDLPGYGFAKISQAEKDRFQRLTYWYLFESDYEQRKVVLIIDAKVGPTTDDLEMLGKLEGREKEVVIVANKIDKVRKSELKTQLEKIQAQFKRHKVIPYSAEKGIGVGLLAEEIFS